MPPPTLDISRSPLPSLANCPMPITIFRSLCRVAPGCGRDRVSSMLCRLFWNAPSNAFVSPSFSAALFRSDSEIGVRSPHTTYMFSSSLSRHLSPLCACANCGGGVRHQAVPVGVAVNPSPMTDIIMFHLDPPQYMSL